MRESKFSRIYILIQIYLYRRAISVNIDRYTCMKHALLLNCISIVLVHR